jgi:uncharacterized membrane protein YfcA
MSAVARLSFVHTTSVADFRIEIAGMLLGGIVAAWLGAGYLRSIPKARMLAVIAVLLLVIAVLLVAETLMHGTVWSLLAAGSTWRPHVAVASGLVVGAISSLLGVAGGEFIIPILMLIFGADIRTAGTASVLISIPVVLTGVARHWLTGHYRSQSLLVYLVLPMAIGSAVGAMLGGYLAAWAPTDALRLVLAAILAISALKLWRKQDDTAVKPE